MIRRSPTPQQLVQTYLILTVVLTGAVLCADAVSAQELPGRNATEDATDVQDQLGNLVVHDYSYNNGEMTISATWHGETPETLTLTEMIELDSGGSTEISFKKVRLIPDSKTEITVAAEQRGGTAAVMLTTPQSIEDNAALVLQAGDATNRGPVPFGTASILIGTAALGGAGLAFAFTAREHKDDVEGERRERIA